MNNTLRGCRPFPIDHDRQNRCKEILESYSITVSELAIHLNCNKSLISNVISGRQLSDATEKKIASFFNLPREAMFPLRTAEQIYYMREAEKKEKEAKAKKKAERMELRAKALSKSGAA